jgi:hypothetical protein
MSDRDRIEYARMARQGQRADEGEHLGPTLILNVLAIPASVQDTRTYNRQKAIDEDLTRRALEARAGARKP